MLVLTAYVMSQPSTFAKLMKGQRKLYNRQIAAEITEKVRKMAADRQITFKMYKRDLKEKDKAQTAPFGAPTKYWPWEEGTNSLAMAKRRIRANFELIDKLGVYAYAAAQVKEAIEITHYLGGENYVF